MREKKSVKNKRIKLVLYRKVFGTAVGFVLFLLLLFAVINGNPSGVSKLERRTLSSFPKMTFSSITDGTFEKEFETYLSDHLVLRNELLYLRARMERTIFGKTENNLVMRTKDGRLLQETSVNAEAFSKTLESISSFSDRLSSTPVILMPVPSAASFEIQEETEIQHQLMKELEDISIKHQNLSIISLENRIRTSLENGEKVYFDTDHHWTTYGASIGASAFLEKVGKEKNLENVKESLLPVKTGFNGSLIASSGFLDLGSRDEIEVYPVDSIHTVTYVEEQVKLASIYDETKLDAVDPYEVFLGGNFPLIEIETTKSQEGKLLILKDSYANSLVPFLVDSFEKIDLVDPRFYNGDLSSKMSEYDMVLILYSMNTLAEDESLSFVLQ